jgi:quercetin dioxygenase-like cupin family protein
MVWVIVKNWADSHFGKGKVMTQAKMLGILVSLLIAIAIWSQEGQARREALTFALDCANSDCPLLKGTPQTGGMRGGSVKLRPGESVGWHSTGAQEEALVILHGTGAANIEGHADVPVHERIMVYIPPGTKHNVTNTGAELLEYVWLVAPAAQK